MSMHDPLHPGLILREFMGELSVSEAAERLDVTRTTLSRILNGVTGISVDMAVRLGKAAQTSAEMWMNLQSQYDLWQATHNKPPVVVVSLREPASTHRHSAARHREHELA